MIFTRKQLKEMAFKDLKFNCYNANYLEYIVKTKNEKALWCEIDFRGLKAINNRHGHDAGDKYMKGILKNLSNFGIVIRRGGDEFWIKCLHGKVPKTCSKYYSASKYGKFNEICEEVDQKLIKFKKVSYDTKR